MRRYLKIENNRLVEAPNGDATVHVFIAPDDAETKVLVNEYRIDEHTLVSCLDPEELSRLEFEPDHAVFIMKRPKNYSSKDNFLFKVASTGVFLFNDKLVIVLAEEAQIYEGKLFTNLSSFQDIILRMIHRAIFHFEEHLKVINMISSSLEQAINTSMENKHLLNLFTLEKSLVYYLNAINSNSVLIEKAKNNAARIGLSVENLEQLDDTIIENNQCREMATIYSNILAGLMDARASIVANNLNVIMKTLNIIMIALMLPTLIVSIFSMNIPLPTPSPDQRDQIWAFWMVMLMACASATIVALLWWRKKI
jgi:magnesium transporter